MNKLEKDINELKALLFRKRTEARRTIIKAHVAKMIEQHKPKTCLSYFSAYRSAFPKLADLFSLPSEQVNSMKDEYRERIMSRTERGEIISLSKAKQKALISKAALLMDSLNWRECAIGLALATGRRTGEILYSAELTSTNKDAIMIFEGLAKQKGYEAKPFAIPVLLPQRSVLVALRYIRTKVQVSSQKEANNRYAKTLNNMFALHFADLLPKGATLHDLRKVYAAIAYKKHGENKSFRGYCSAVLGHSDTGLTTEAYMKYKAL